MRGIPTATLMRASGRNLSTIKRWKAGTSRPRRSQESSTSGASSGAHAHCLSVGAELDRFEGVLPGDRAISRRTVARFSNDRTATGMERRRDEHWILWGRGSSRSCEG